MNIQNINSKTKAKSGKLPKRSADIYREIAGTMQVLEWNQISALESLVVQLLREVESMSLLRSHVEEGMKGCNLSLESEVQRFEIGLIRSALIQAGGVQCKAAKLLGINPTTLNVKIKRYKIELGNFKNYDE